MTQKDIDKLYEDCGKDDDKFEEIIGSLGGRRFVELWEDRAGLCTYSTTEEVMDFLEEYGFQIFADPAWQEGWIVFEPEK